MILSPVFYLITVRKCRHNTDLVHVTGHDRITLVIFSQALHVQGSLMMDPLWSETCWSAFKYFIILIVSTYYIWCISWIILTSSVHLVGFIWKRLHGDSHTVNKTCNSVTTKSMLEVFRTVLHFQKFWHAKMLGVY